ncbi:hypothetical protein Ahy_A09g044457 isoform A [Arachis hypogaea]|uniref:Uncharacterized protein n=1 Tax=Arachis hypogaea TaxID=3818 RepID=A0A445BKC8_ARAHY|nr:hypothetical protein Ahy_A09g044457 isoform A [Arachis hypogaea]
MLRIDQSSFTPTLADRKSWQGLEKKRRVGRGELYLLTHKRPNGSYIHDVAQTIGRDEFSRLLSQNDSLVQALGKEHSGRVHGIGFGPTSSHVFGMNSHQPSNGFQREETQRLAAKKLKRKAVEDKVAAEKTKRQVVEDEVVVEKTKKQAVEDEVAAEKTKRHAMEDEVAAEKIRMQTIESALICLLQGQGGKLQSNVTKWMIFGSGAPASSSLRPFCLSRSEQPPTPQACTNDVQNLEPNTKDLYPEVDEVDYFEQHVDNLFAASEAQKRKRHKTTEF